MRISAYFISIVIFINIPLSYIEGKSFCILYNLFDIKCFGCGTTRAVFNLLHLNLAKAVRYNLFAVFLFQIVMILIMQDIIQVIRFSFKENKKSVNYSMIERILRAVHDLNKDKINDNNYIK